MNKGKHHKIKLQWDKSPPLNADIMNLILQNQKINPIGKKGMCIQCSNWATVSFNKPKKKHYKVSDCMEEKPQTFLSYKMTISP